MLSRRLTARLERYGAETVSARIKGLCRRGTEVHFDSLEVELARPSGRRTRTFTLGGPGGHVRP